MAEYKSKFTGAEIDDGVAKARAAVVMQSGDTLTWDGNTEGLVSPEPGIYKVSDAVPTLNDISNGLIAIVQGTEAKITASELEEMMIDGVISAGGFMIVPTEIAGTDWSGLVFPEAGTYFIEGVCSSITIPGYTGFGQETLDPNYLPTIPASKLPGALMLYIDNENYLYADSDTSDTSKRITRQQFKKIFNNGKFSLYIKKNEFSFEIPCHIHLGSDGNGYGYVSVRDALGSNTYYTAEYTGT